ncbi:diguanylate cyclase [Ectothiorhodospiraceae bacterium WFHF3C12]|nr:diguanylate cyclase [Ectothiorhodospiraceae bacterium WFHF3C12]
MNSNGTVSDRNEPSHTFSLHEQRLGALLETVQELSLARSLPEVMEMVRTSARTLTGADGSTFVLREGDLCYYADEDAISPLWKGQRFPLSQCVSGWVMSHGETCLIEDITADERVPQDVYANTFVRSMLMVPIRTRAPLGAIGNYWAHLHAPTPTERKLLEALANAAAVALERIRAYEELEKTVEQRTAELREANEQLRVEVAVRREAENEVRRASLLDPLTGVLNRRGFMERARQKLQSLRGMDRPAMVLFSDVDGLKRVNDTHGHAFGDQLLRDYAAILEEVFRDGDLIGRIGGDEFAVFAEGDSPAAMQARLASRLQHLNDTAARPYNVSASLGCRTLVPPIDSAASITELLAEADQAMYASKPAPR